MARYAFLWTLLLASTCFGQLTVKDNYDPYEPIIAGCNCIIPPNGKVQFLWQADSASRSITSQDGVNLYIWSPPGSHSVEAVVVTEVFQDLQVWVPDPANPNDVTKAKLQTVKTLVDFNVQRYQKNYAVGVVPPAPPTPPGPNPPGPNPPPDPTDDFGKQALAWLKAVPASSYSKAKATAIADNFSATAAQAVATSGWDLTAFVTDTKKRNLDKLTPDDVAAWSAPFFNPLAQYQAGLFASRKLTTTDVKGIAQIWRETSDAIKAAVAAMSSSQGFILPDIRIFVSVDIPVPPASREVRVDSDEDKATIARLYVERDTLLQDNQQLMRNKQRLEQDKLQWTLEKQNIYKELIDIKALTDLQWVLINQGGRH